MIKIKIRYFDKYDLLKIVSHYLDYYHDKIHVFYNTAFLSLNRCGDVAYVDSTIITYLLCVYVIYLYGIYLGYSPSSPYDLSFSFSLPIIKTINHYSLISSVTAINYIMIMAFEKSQYYINMY